MIDYNNSYCIIGSASSGKSALANNLLNELKSSGKNVERITLEDFKNMPTMDELIKMQTENDFTKFSQQEVTRFMGIRTKFPNVRNFAELGYTIENEQKLNAAFGKAAVDLYNKQFENMLFEDLCKAFEAEVQEQESAYAVILDTTSTLPVDFSKQVPNLKEQIKEKFPDTYTDFIKDEKYLDNQITNAAIKKFKNVWHTKLPTDERFLNEDAKKKAAFNKKLESFGEYETLATTTIDTKNFMLSGKYSDSEIQSQIKEAMKTKEVAEPTEEESKKPKNEKKEGMSNEELKNIRKKYKKPSFLRKALTFIGDYMFGFIIPKTIFKKVFGIGKKKTEEEIYLDNMFDESAEKATVEKVSEEELQKIKEQEAKEEVRNHQKESKENSTEKSSDPNNKEKGENEQGAEMGNG
ncbi:MAG: ATP-binding protein [Clostridia bacterium]|nr:ATP-binding protein [Clostridia bacterium]